METSVPRMDAVLHKDMPQRDKLPILSVQPVAMDLICPFIAKQIQFPVRRLFTAMEMGEFYNFPFLSFNLMPGHITQLPDAAIHIDSKQHHRIVVGAGLHAKGSVFLFYGFGHHISGSMMGNQKIAAAAVQAHVAGRSGKGVFLIHPLWLPCFPAKSEAQDPASPAALSRPLLSLIDNITDISFFIIDSLPHVNFRAEISYQVQPPGLRLIREHINSFLCVKPHGKPAHNRIYLFIHLTAPYLSSIK